MGGASVQAGRITLPLLAYTRATENRKPTPNPSNDAGPELSSPPVEFCTPDCL